MWLAFNGFYVLVIVYLNSSYAQSNCFGSIHETCKDITYAILVIALLHNVGTIKLLYFVQIQILLEVKLMEVIQYLNVKFC